MKLRDHDQECDHAPDDNETDEDDRHYRYLTGHHRANGEWCPGGQPITINLEAAAKKALEHRMNKEDGWISVAAVPLIIEAALETSNEE